MTIGDWLEKIKAFFGGKPLTIHRCEKRIAEVDTKIKHIQENINQILEENKNLDNELQEKKRQLSRETVQANKVMLQELIKALNDNFQQKTQLSTFLTNQMVNLQILRGKVEISIAQARTGVSCDLLESQLDELEDVLEEANEANKIGKVLRSREVQSCLPNESTDYLTNETVPQEKTKDIPVECTHENVSHEDEIAKTTSKDETQTNSFIPQA